MKVLLATDGSQNATKAAKFLLRLPSTDQIELTVLTVTYNPIDNSHGNIQPWFAKWNKHERDMVESHHAELRALLADRFASLSLIHRKGNASQTILNIAKTLNTDLIVMGAVGHSMISRMLLGSISDEVATRAACSVLIVRPSRDDTSTDDSGVKITVAYDHSTPSQNAIDEMLGMKWGDSAVVDLVTIALQFDYFIGDGLSPVAFENEQEVFESMQKSGKKTCEKVAQSIPNAHSYTVRSGHTGEAIIQHAENNGSDLIVAGDANHGMLHHLLLGSTTKYILRHAPCSVWISRQHHSNSQPHSSETEQATTS